MTKLFDAHLHIIDPVFPLIENEGFQPEPFTCDDYMQKMKKIELAGGAVVSGSFQGHDQTYLVEALRKLGGNFAGVTQIPHDTSEEEIINLHEAGVRAVRFNLRRGGRADVTSMRQLADKVYMTAGWHAEIYADAKNLNDQASDILKMPAVSLDHLGLSREGFRNVLYFAEKGVKIKASGFGRVDFDVVKAVKEIYQANPEALMFGTDLPSTRAERPYSHADIDVIYEALTEREAEDVLFKNALTWYRKGI
nr:amidohydrolase family protein [Alkalicoccus halolimnae]TXF83259.1 amidohydrolase family protein [Alkalicoccus halolimnae]